MRGERTGYVERLIREVSARAAEIDIDDRNDPWLRLYDEYGVRRHTNLSSSSRLLIVKKKGRHA